MFDCSEDGPVRAAAQVCIQARPPRHPLPLDWRAFMYPSQPVRRTSGLAVASLVLGLAGFIPCGLTSIPAVIFGHVALGQIRRDRLDGHGMAVAGTVLGWILTGGWLVFWGLWWAGLLGSIGLSAVTEPDRVPVPVVEQNDSAPQDDRQEGQRVVFEATGEGTDRAGNVTTGIGLAISQDNGVPLPYTKRVDAEPGDRLYLWVQNGVSEGAVTCRIKLGKKVLREATSTGPYGVCTVSATLD